jgi:hypothetical protein
MRCVAVPDAAGRANPEFAAEADVVLASLEQVDGALLTSLVAPDPAPYPPCRQS